MLQMSVLFSARKKYFVNFVGNFCRSAIPSHFNSEV